MKTLKLTLKKQYFDQILSGEKLEEYRNPKKYWFDRLVFQKEKVKAFFGMNNLTLDDFDLKCEQIIKNQFNSKMIAFIPFDCVEFTNGYSVNSPKVTLEYKGIEIRTGNPKYGAEKDKPYFVIKLGKEISRLNC